ncbi:MAG: hypothetical protein K2F96_02100, partial [Muribaculaceae bacterium]|nr:hypothetical protein [Muribaculaceae bacterium]
TYGCTPIKDFSAEEHTPVEGKEIIIGGMVIDFQQRQGMKGPFGILKIEDLSGQMELRLFGQTFAKFNSYCTSGQQILITGQFQRRYANEDLRFNITSVSLLSEMKGKVVRGISIQLMTDRIEPALADILRESAQSKGEGETGRLEVRIYDPTLNRGLTLTSPVGVAINKKLVERLESIDVDYQILTA